MAIAVLITIVGGLALITTYENRISITSLRRDTVIDRSSGVDIIVKGAVDYPGVYRLPLQMSMKDVLNIASIQSNADVGRYKMDRIVKRGRVIHVPHRKMIAIHLKGAVKNAGTIFVPKGTRLMDLKELMVFEDDADKKMLEKKRVLRAEDIVEVPLSTKGTKER
jgi:hypothetical protein